MSISMKRYNDTIITPKDDRILFDQIFDDYGLIYGGSATMAASNKIHVGAARGFIKGTEVIIEAEDIAVNLSDSGTKNGRLKIVMDLADTETPIKFESEVAASFPALEQDANINYDNGRYEVVFATYKATETTISSVTLVMPTMQSVKAKIQDINQSLTTENGTKFRFGQTSDGEYGYIINKDGADTVIPFKSGFDLLWTNPSPTGLFNPNWINNMDLSEYKLIMIITRTSINKDLTPRGITIFSVLDQPPKHTISTSVTDTVYIPTAYVLKTGIFYKCVYTDGGFPLYILGSKSDFGLNQYID